MYYLTIMKSLYIDASNSGISGDMFLAALFELIPNISEIIKELQEVKAFLAGVSKLEIGLEKVKRSGILLNRLKISIKEEKTNRTPKILKDSLNAFLKEKNFSSLAKIYANDVLDKLIKAEADVHGKLIDQIHLHELSSIDTLVDILGVTKLLDTLGAFENNFKIFCSKIPLGCGTIKSAHGTLPVPAPATLKILENSNLYVQKGPIESELTTPTGAALLVCLKPINCDCTMKLNKVSYSTGKNEFKDFLNIFRLFLVESEDSESETQENALLNYVEPITILETDVDDVSGELLGNLINKFSKENILDVQIIPSITKKNRPSQIVKILCRPEYKYEIMEKIFDELGTLGVRFNTINRVCVERKVETRNIEINGKNYDLKFKISFFETQKGKKIVNIKPEYEDLKRISENTGIPLKKILWLSHNQINQLYQEYKDI